MSLGTVPLPDTTPTPDRSPRPSHRFWRGAGSPGDAPWVRPALVAMLGATALLYLWGLGASGWANSFYSAAAQAGSESWKAFFFGSSDAANSITVDKPPLSLWAMGLSVRVFGLSSWSILVPEALMGVASVGLLYATVRRATESAAAGLIAGVVLATTPVAALMFRFNNPDALLVLLLVGSAAATVRAVEASRRPVGNRRVSPALRWLVLAGGLVGLAFLTKMLQAFLVLPGLAGGYLLAAEATFRTRVRHVLVAGASVTVTAGWWIGIVALWPAASRPYIGGSQDNSVLGLALGYNGLGRLTGEESGSVGGQAGWGATGLLRMFNGENGGQVAWLLPSAVIVALAAAWLLRRSPRSDLAVAGLVVWGGWLAVTTLTFSLMQGIFHPYYTVALAPAIAALAGIGVVTLWRHRDQSVAPLTLGASTASAATLAFVLLGRSDGYLPWLRWVILVGGITAALALCLAAALKPAALAAVAGIALTLSLAGPAAFSISTAATPHEGSIPSAGPATFSGVPGGLVRLMLGGPAGAATGAGGGPGQLAGRAPTGGLLSASVPSAELTSLLEADAADYSWVAATVGSNSASGYQLATGEPVMPVGGFNGTDPSPTLDAFKALVERGEIHYFVGDEFGFGGITPGGASTSEISAWVAANFTAQTVDGVTVYDLTAGG